jgi:hypothetical protein
VVALPCWAGAKAAADPARRERAASFMVIFVRDKTKDEIVVRISVMVLEAKKRAEVGVD